MSPETKKVTVLSPLSLYRHDLFHLEKILLKHITCAGCDLNITAVDHGHKMSVTPFHSMVGLFQSGKLPENLDEITIEGIETGPDKSLVKDVKIFISKRLAYLKVLSREDNNWAEETFNDLNNFLSSRKVWFSFLARAMPPISNSSIVISILLALPAVLTQNYYALIFPFIIVSSAISLLTLNLRGELYSVGRINMINHGQDTRPEYERWVIWLYFSVVILCILGTVLTTWSDLSGI